MLIDLVTAIVGAADLEEGSSIAAEGLATRLAFEWVAVVLRDEDRIVAVAPAVNDDDHAADLTIPGSPDLLSYATEVMSSPSVAADRPEEGLSGRTAGLIASPIVAGQEVKGALLAQASPEAQVAAELQGLIEQVARFLGAYIASVESRTSERHHLDQLIELQNITARIIRDPRSSNDRKDVLDEIAEAFNFVAVGIGVVEARRVAFFRRYRDAVAGQHIVSTLHVDTGFAGRAIRTGEPQIVEDVSSEPDYINFHNDFDQQLCVPIRDDAGVIGVLLLQAAAPREIAVEDLGTALMLSETLGLAITNHRRFTALQRRNQQLELVDSVVALIAARASLSDDLPEILDDLAFRFDYSLVALGWLRGDNVEFDVIAFPRVFPIDPVVPSSRGVVGRVARTGEPAFLPDVGADSDFIDGGIGSVSEICYPVRVNSEIVAVLNIETTGARRLDDADFEIVGIIAKHLGIAFETESLLQSEREARRAIQAIERISAVVSSALDIVEAYRLTAQTLQDAFEYPYVIVGSIEDEVVSPQAAAGIELERLAPMPLGQGLVGRSARDQNALLASGSPEGPDFLPVDANVASQVVVPIMSGGVASGVIQVSGSPAHPVGERDLEMVQLLADHAAVSINNARHYDEIRQLASIDPITDLPNHRSFQDVFVERFEQAEMDGRRLTIMIIDLDDFKQVNDRLGHLEGDRVLNEVASRLRSVLRDDDLLARYAGDEFVLVLQDTTTDQAQDIGRRLVEAIRGADFGTEVDQHISVGISVGFATFPDDVTRRVELLRAADKAMFNAKEHGKDGVMGYQDITDVN